MKILLDENIPLKIINEFSDRITVKTVSQMDWRGVQNGQLLKLLDNYGFDFLLTMDKNIQFQQHLQRYKVKVILIIAPDNKHQTVKNIIPKVEEIILSKHDKDDPIIIVS